MHLLFLGYSSIVERRVLPAARSVAAIERISVASRRQEVGRALSGSPGEPAGFAPHSVFADYDEALRSSGADAVYVSGINSEHEGWVTRALDRGLHVMVDKPAFPALDTARAAADAAGRRGCVLAEATVFTYHPQAAALQELLPRTDAASTRITAVLTIPPRPPGDFRMRVEAGGGALYDLAPYAAATSRLVFGTPPEHVDCRVLTWDGPDEAGHSGRGVDTSFSVLLSQANGGALAGHFGFVTTYQNRLAAVSANRTVDVERFFTTPPDTPGALRVRDGDRDRQVEVPAADSFAVFIQQFIDAATRRDGRSLAAALLDDAALVARMRKAALD